MFCVACLQDHIRNYGSAITRLEVYSDMRPFFTANPRGVYNGPGGSTNLAAVAWKGAVVQLHSFSLLLGTTRSRSVCAARTQYHRFMTDATGAAT
jgi:hypothetical protein